MILRGAIYRWFMRWVHKYNWHYAPLIGPFEDGATQRWCKWCGFRETYRPHSYTPVFNPMYRVLENSNVGDKIRYVNLVSSIGYGRKAQETQC